MKNVKMYRNRGENRRKRSGFTLMEILIVIFILLLLAGIAVGVFNGTRERAKIDTTKINIRVLKSQVDRYNLEVGNYPTTAQGLDALLQPPADLPDPSKWGGPYLEDNTSPLDPWGNPYQYVSPSQHTRGGFDIWSLGPDGQDGTDDDIGTWSKL